MIVNHSDSGPVIVGVDGSERSVEALALADLLEPALGRRVVIAHVHPFRQPSSLFAEGECERLEREVAESTFEQIREHLPSVSERRELLAGESGGLDLLVVGSRYGPLRAVLLGSVSSARVRSAQSPLVVGPRGAEE